MKQSVQQAAPSFHSLRRALAAANSPSTCRQAALAVMEAYSHLYSQYGVQAKLDLMQETSTGISPLPILSNAERAEVQAFCRFTGLLAEAAAVLSRVQSYDNDV